MKKFRKKGQVFIEYIIVLPLMIISLWLILQLIVYVYANNQVDHAADAGASIVAQELRGTESKLTALSNKAEIIDDLYSRLNQSLSNNGFVLFSTDSNNNSLTLSNFNQYIENKQNCNTALQDNSVKRVLCVYTESITVSGRSHDEIIVRVKVPFKIIGNFVPGLEDKVFLYGNGATTKDISGRFQYY
ncbi:TadE family protein [Bacillus mexicanus]|uniref:TadE/TadG family type IV pilus assembly protein n=1 Tax=Bacillus mexicanus TaxID=2834415 RepID=UPI003D22A405